MIVDFNIDTKIWALPLTIAYDTEFNLAISISVLCFSIEIYF